MANLQSQKTAKKNCLTMMVSTLPPKVTRLKSNKATTTVSIEMLPASSQRRNSTQQEDGREVQASEDTTNLLPQNVKSEEQDDAEEALLQEAKIVPDALPVST